MIDDAKHWYTSKTILAALIGPVLVILAVLFKIDLRDQADAIVNSIVAAGVVFSGVMSIIGRLKASAPIKGTAVAATAMEVRTAIAVDPDTQARVEAVRKMANFKG